MSAVKLSCDLFIFFSRDFNTIIKATTCLAHVLTFKSTGEGKNSKKKKNKLQTEMVLFKFGLIVSFSVMNSGSDMQPQLRE